MALKAVRLVALGILVGTDAFAQNGTRPSTESFLSRPASRVGDVVRQVQTDAATRGRYARFFHLSDAQILPYLRANLFEGTLPATGDYTVTCVRAVGTFYPTKQSLRRGERVFCGRDGRPFLQWQSGNPLVPFVTAREIVRVRALPRPAVDKLAPTTSPSIIIPSQPDSSGTLPSHP